MKNFYQNLLILSILSANCLVYCDNDNNMIATSNSSTIITDILDWFKSAQNMIIGSASGDEKNLINMITKLLVGNAETKNVSFKINLFYINHKH